MDNGGMRIAVFLLLGVAGITALSTLVGSGDPPEASALEQDEPLSIEEIPSHAERLAGAPVLPSPPETPAALLEFLKSDPLPDDCDWVIAPLLNPSGLRAGTRGNADGIDLNRDFYRLRSEEVNAVTDWWSRQRPRNLVHLSLHEDWEAEGFYLYEINSGGRDPLGSRIVERISSQFPIQSHGPVDDHELSGPGLILHAPEPDDLEGWPEAIWLAKHHPVLSLTFEAPGTYGIRLRRTGLMAALAATVRRVSGPRHRRAA